MDALHERLARSLAVDAVRWALCNERLATGALKISALDDGCMPWQWAFCNGHFAGFCQALGFGGTIIVATGGTGETTGGQLVEQLLQLRQPVEARLQQ